MRDRPWFGRQGPTPGNRPEQLTDGTTIGRSRQDDGEQITDDAAWPPFTALPSVDRSARLAGLIGRSPLRGQPKRHQTSMINRFTITAIAVVASLAITGCAPAQDGEQETSPSVTVVHPVTEDVIVTQTVTGRFQAVDAVDVRPQVTGRLVRVHFADGQRVRRGDLLFTLDPSEFRPLVDEARAQRDLADIELTRAEQLRSSGAVSEQEYVRQRQEALRLRAAATRAEVRLAFTQVRAPVDGRISDRRVDVGNVVVADETLLTRIVSEDPIHFEFSADPTLALRLIRAGARSREVRIETGAGDALPARLDFLDNQIDGRTGVVRGRAVLANPDRLIIPGQFGRIRLEAAQLTRAMLVPETAISADQTRRYVLVVNSLNQVEAAPVSPGPLIEGRRVVEGLDPQARVIIAGGAAGVAAAFNTPLAGLLFAIEELASAYEQRSGAD
ncbi:hypothetical protein LTR94_023671 [Friedmanniomyces endolithicus]|nr:hypothetical protein LTR94_023671 [Friedmanniomyces endolithicus]